MEFKSRYQATKTTKLSHLGGVNTSSKIIKNMKYNHMTYVLYLAPAESSGYISCSHATPECRLGCLATSGRAGMEKIAGFAIIENARIKKTRLLFEEQDFFMQWLIAEISARKKLATKNNYNFSVRLNGTSDIDWANVRFKGENIFEIFNDVEFYDYSKNPAKFYHKIPNYHLTFSYTGRNENLSIAFLNKKINVAVVFDVKKGEQLPEKWNGFKVIDGDDSDLRLNDEKGVVVGLRWKRIADKTIEKQIKNTIFVVKNKSC